MKKKFVFLLIMVATMLTSSLIITTTAFAGWGDDSDADYPEVGGEWVEDYPGTDLYQTFESVYGLVSKLNNYGWTWSFIYGDTLAWEEDFKKQSSGGTDYLIADRVDLVIFSGHTANNGSTILFADQNHDDDRLWYSEAEWGDQDLEWVFLDSCRNLNDDNIGNWFTAMNGLHLICGAKNDTDDYDNGTHVADLLIDNGWWDEAVNVKMSWFLGVDYDQPSGVVLRVLGETSGNGDDYIWQQGSVSSDPTHDASYTYWTYNC